MSALFKRPFPNNLEDLRLISVKTSPMMIEYLLDKLGENCLLRKLCLVKCSLVDSHVPRIINSLGGRFLIELDISWS